MVLNPFASHYHAICTYTMQSTSGRRDNTKKRFKNPGVLLWRRNSQSKVRRTKH